ncbi:MAG: hypothetical protein A3B95_01090 [Candidatus Doudnabacteria bacterium RIFCSPHIGHO2_02_FULL_43_13b]|nr:MAG: hypothetical protein A3B95_01090 [Candidatus Doudnabacteria bacterium RIFCSPHIGHO2_02_FULL_43_13b]
MTKLSKRALDPKDLGYYINNLWSAFTLLDSKDEVRSFFRDIFTHTEYKMLAKRLEIGRRLLEGQTYESISEDLKVTPPTITSISNALERGGSGLRTVHEKLQYLEKSLQRKKSERQDRLEHRRLPKFRESTFAANVLREGFGTINKVLKRRTRETSARKQLPV